MTTATAWREVTKAEPCPACGKPDWCAWSHDGNLKCERVAEAPHGFRRMALKGEGAVFTPDDDPQPTRQKRDHFPTAEAADGEAELIVRMNEDGDYEQVEGGRQELREGDRDAIIGEILTATENWLTWQAIQSEWKKLHPTVKGCGKPQLLGSLNYGAKQGHWQKRGSGRKGDPFEFRRAS